MAKGKPVVAEEEPAVVEEPVDVRPLALGDIRRCSGTGDCWEGEAGFSALVCVGATNSTKGFCLERSPSRS